MTIKNSQTIWKIPGLGVVIYVPLGSIPVWSVGVTNTNYWSSEGFVGFDKSKYGRIAHIYLVAIFKMDDAINTGYVKLYNQTDGADVAGSVVSGNPTSFALHRSSDIKANLAAAEKLLNYHMMVSAGTMSLTQVYLEVELSD